MIVSQKCEYALRALFELSQRNGEGPVKIAAIARSQAIPARFLEVILGELKQAGFVASQRGRRGGYYLCRSPGELTVGDVVRFVQGPVGPVACVADGAEEKCPLSGDCVFLPMWRRVHKAIVSVYDTTTFQDLLEEDSQNAREYVPCYSI